VIQKVNTAYVSGPIDELVFAAADAAGLPELVTSGLDSGWFAWHWDVTPARSTARAEVVLRLMKSIANHDVVFAVTVRLYFAHRPEHDQGSFVDHARAATPFDVDPDWLAATLHTACTMARQQAAVLVTGPARWKGTPS